MPSENRSVVELLQAVARNIQDIVQAEVRLAKAEIRTVIARASRAGVVIGIGAISAALCALFSFLAALFALALIMPPWAAALAVAASLAVIAIVTLRIGSSQMKLVGDTKPSVPTQEGSPWIAPQKN